MNICHVTFDHNWSDTRVFKREATTLKAAGHNVILVCGDNTESGIKEGIKVICYANHLYSRKERLMLLFNNEKLVKYLLSLNADIYQVHDVTLLEVGIKIKKAGKHVVFDCHENYMDTIPENLANKTRLPDTFFRRMFERYINRAAGRFDAIYTVSPNMVCALRRFNAKTYMVPNFPSINNYEKPSFVSKENFFVFQGTVYSISNQKSIVKALSLLDSDVRYKVIGTIFDAQRKEIEDNDLKGRVDTIGWIERDKLNEVMQKAIGGIVILDYSAPCCYKEGQLGSNKIFEYMLCGLPVICTDYKLWKEMIIDKYRCGICVTPGDVEQIKSAMEWIISHPVEAVEMGERGREAILSEFNWENYVEDYLSYYKQIL